MFYVIKRPIFVAFIYLLLTACVDKPQPGTTPWGTEVGSVDDTASVQDGVYSMEDIVSNGEMIVLTISGPDTYYDYHGHGLGVQYMMCEDFARSKGVSVRVELCRDTLEMVSKLRKGIGDLVAVRIPKQKYRDLRYCGSVNAGGNAQWAVAKGNASLAKAIDSWYRKDMESKTEDRENYILSVASVRRKVYSPVLDSKRGIMSSYDNLLRKYAPISGLDWRLLAAQCYQESCYDSQAVSWAGAMGLMQIMPTTAKRYGVAKENLFNPEINISTGVRIMRSMMSSFSDITTYDERINFALAAYNAGPGHIRDAMALAKKEGRRSDRWDVVAEYVLLLSEPEYYQDPVVRHGFMRGKETVGYVASIRRRWGR